MARRFRPLSADRVGDLPSVCAGCVLWESGDRLVEFRCGSVCDAGRAAAWVREVSSAWGEPGRMAVEDGQVLGFIKYAPPERFPQAGNMPAGPPEPTTPLIACMHIAPDARRRGLGKVLMQAALRDLHQRGERAVQAYATTRQGDFSASPVVGVEFLLRMGFTVARPHPELPLMRLDLRSLAAWTENLEAVLESLRIPIGVAPRAPVTYLVDVDTEGAR